MKNRCLLFLLFISAVFLTHAQSSGVRNVKGKVTNEASLPLPYVSITLANDISLGTYTNADGIFSFIIPGILKKDSLIFSCIGYESAKISMSTLNTEDSIYIYLKPKEYLLGEVTITPDTALEIVRKSVKKLDINLSNSKSILQGFFREIIRSDYTYDRLVEAAVDVFDRGYSSAKDNELLFKVREIRKSDDYRDLDWMSSIINYINPTNGLHGDFESLFFNDYIRNNKCFYEMLLNAPLNEEFFSAVLFSIDSTTSYDNSQVFCIGIHPKDDSLGILPHGSIHIRSDNFAILQMEFEGRVHPKVEIPFAVPGQEYMHKTLIQYKEYNNKMYLSFIYRKSFRFDMNSTKFDKTKAKGKAEGHFYHEFLFMTNEIVTEKDKIKLFRKKERQRKDQDLYSTKWKYNNEFWKSYNAIVERPLEPSVQKDIEREIPLDEQFKKNSADN